MGSTAGDKPHAVCIPFPAQGHINPMLQLAKLLYSKGFSITFVNTEFNHLRLLNSRGPGALKGLDAFRFVTIPDSLPPSDLNATQDVPALFESVRKNFLAPFCDLLTSLKDASSGVPPVTCVIPDGIMNFALEAADKLCIPAVAFWTTSAIGFMGYLHYPELIQRGLVPLKDETDVTNGYLDTPINWIPGMKDVRLRDMPSFVRTTDPDDIMFNFLKDQAQRTSKAPVIILNTFDYLEPTVLDAMMPMLPPVYTIGPLSLLIGQIPDGPVNSLGSNLWAEDTGCFSWLEGKEHASVVYVNFGSITTMTNQQLAEFAWGLANSNHDFLWIIRPDLVKGNSSVLPQEFLSETKGRGLLSSWCHQEQVLSHPSIGVFLTHCGWNSTIESICGGVPVICWPFFAEQQTNCRYACTEWGIGMEIDNNVKKAEVEGLIRELMDGEKGKKTRSKALDWKRGAIASTQPGGTSYENFNRLVNELLVSGNGVSR